MTKLFDKIKNDGLRMSITFLTLSLYSAYQASLVAQTVRHLSAMQVDPGLIPGLGRYPGEGNGSLFQYSCLENSMDRGVW